MAEKSLTVSPTIDLHAHLYPEGCFGEVLKDRSDLLEFNGARNPGLLVRIPTDQL